MFVIRPDIYKKKERTDKLKIAFATAASAGLGLGAAWLVAGKTGVAIYTVATAYHYAKREWQDIKRNRETSYARHPFRQGQNEANQISSRAGMKAPPVFYADDRLVPRDGASAGTKDVLMGIGFAVQPDASHMPAVLAHEIGHIKNKDCRIKRLLNSFPNATQNTAELLAATGAVSVLLAGPPVPGTVLQLAQLAGLLFGAFPLSSLQILLMDKISRIQEFRADRFAARVTDCPLDLSIYFHEDPSAYPFSDTFGRLKALVQTHPPNSHRIKALVQLCKRVPDQHPS